MLRITRSMSYAAGLRPESATRPASDRRSAIGDLPAVVHPIFSRKNIYSKIDYELIYPALVLASKLISEPCVLPFWYTILFSEVQPTSHILRYGWNGYGAYEFTDAPTTLTQEQIRKTQTALVDFHSRLWISLWHPSSEGAMRRHDMQTVIIHEGTFAYMAISPDLIARLAEAARLTKQTDDPRYYTLASFRLGLDVVHELTHAVCGVTRGHGDFYFLGSVVSEDGYEWESQIFGGLVTGAFFPEEVASKKQEEFASKPFRADVVAWPNAQHICHYIRDDNPIGLRLSDAEYPYVFQLPVRGDWARQIVSHYDVALIEKMFTQRFWNHDVAERGVQAFRLSTYRSTFWPFPREWMTSLLSLYDRGAEDLKVELEAARASDDKGEYEKLQQLWQRLEKFYKIWNIRPEVACL